MKRTILITSIFIISMILAVSLAGCLGNSENTSTGGAASQPTPWPKVTVNELASGEKMPRLETLPPELLEPEPFAEPEINNGAAYVKEYMGAVYYTDNVYIRMAVPEGGVLIDSKIDPYNPSSLDVYKNVLYYCEDESEREAHTLYKVDLNDVTHTEKIMTDLISKEFTGRGGTFLVAEDTIFYLNLNSALCSRNLSGANETMLIEEPVTDLKFRTGWIYYIDPDNRYLYRVKTEGGKPEMMIEETIDFYYLTQDSIVYQTGFFIPGGYSQQINDENRNYYFRELGQDGTINTLMVGDIDSGNYYTYDDSYNCYVQLIFLDASGVYFVYFDYIESKTTLYKYADGKKIELSELLVDDYVFPAIMIDDWIYCFCYYNNDIPSEGFYSIKKDGSFEEKLGEYYWMPQYMHDGTEIMTEE